MCEGFDLRAIAIFAWLPWVVADLRRAERWVAEFCASHGVGRRLIARRKWVIWLGAVLVAMAVVPAFYVESSRVALALICFGLVCYSGEGSVFFTLAYRFVPG